MRIGSNAPDGADHVRLGRCTDYGFRIFSTAPTLVSGLRRPPDRVQRHGRVSVIAADLAKRFRLHAPLQGRLEPAGSAVVLVEYQPERGRPHVGELAPAPT
ncbi:hypothetical protein GCM10023405_19820 [Streptomonospora salina]